MTLRNFVGALARRELAPGSLGPALLMSVAAGGGAAVLAGRFSGAQSGSIMMIIEMDRTLAGMLAIVAVFRVIARMSADADGAWLQQVVAAGAARATYVAALLLSITIALVACYAAGTWAFTGVVAAASGDNAPALRGLATLPLIPVLLFAAASFGAAVYGVAGSAAARPTAVVLLAAPWILTWVALVSDSEVLPGWIMRAVAQQAPPLGVSLSVQPVARLLMYAGITFALAVALDERRMARL